MRQLRDIALAGTLAVAMLFGMVPVQQNDELLPKPPIKLPVQSGVGDPGHGGGGGG